MTALTASKIAAALVDLPGWTWKKDTLVRTFTFPTFRDAMGFMVRAAFEADAKDHHPEWTNIYDRVVVRLTSHDAGDKVTAKDIALARHFSALVSPPAP